MGLVKCLRNLNCLNQYNSFGNQYPIKGDINYNTSNVIYLLVFKIHWFISRFIIV